MFDFWDKIWDKITSYNLLNHLFPGVVFCVLASHFTSVDLMQDDLVVGVFFYYFVGVVISRIGSVLVERFLMWIGFIRYESYIDYLNASKNDTKISILLETSNMYRSVVAMILSLALLKLYIYFSQSLGDREWGFWVLISSLFILFLYSYRKQNKYITSRIRRYSND